MIPLIPSGALAEGTTQGVEHPQGEGGLILVRRHGRAYGYRNRCPHTGAPLDWNPGQFLDAEGRHLICALHGALFRIEDGACLAGPCRGEGLEAVPLCEHDGMIYLEG